MGKRPDGRFAVHAVCFELLTALLDSWTLWEAVAAEAGHPGRQGLAFQERSWKGQRVQRVQRSLPRAPAVTDLSPFRHSLYTTASLPAW